MWTNAARTPRRNDGNAGTNNKKCNDSLEQFCGGEKEEQEVIPDLSIQRALNVEQRSITTESYRKSNSHVVQQDG